MRTHGESKTRLHDIWRSMKSRCKNETNGSYRWYGGKGIQVCEEWDTYFIAFREWAMNNGYNDILTIDRIDSSRDYEPDNCRWVTMKEQQNNRCNNHRIVFNGEEFTLTQWAERIGLTPNTLSKRLQDGWSIERALTTPKVVSKSHPKNN